MNSNDLQTICPVLLVFSGSAAVASCNLPILLQCALVCPAGSRVLRAAPPSREAPSVRSRQVIAHHFKLWGVATVPGGATFVSSRASFESLGVFAGVAERASKQPSSGPDKSFTCCLSLPVVDCHVILLLKESHLSLERSTTQAIVHYFKSFGD